jgi:MoaA/NifB/PqqE/SkfB family radical SAM enzyme
MPAGAWVGFQTNGQLLTRARAVALVEAGVDKVCISSDAVTPDMFRAMRAGGDRAAVDSSVEALQAAARRSGRRVSLGVEFVATRHNIDELPHLLHWAARHAVDFVIVTHMLPYHQELVDDVVFDTNTDQALQLFKQWKAEAERDGIDLNEYFDCYIGGLVKYVRPESFGCLVDRSIFSIWNDPAFQAFRQGVLKYDFPFCYDCSVALCDYTQFEDFEQDCHISPVPCGACLWCTGLFQCLQ